MTEKHKTYGRPMLKDLIMQARELGIEVSFYKDMDENYVIVHKVVVGSGPNSTVKDEEHRPPHAAAACWMVKGMIAAAKSKICGLLSMHNRSL
jgi:hypothetical protein